MDVSREMSLANYLRQSQDTLYLVQLDRKTDFRSDPVKPIYIT